jgi:hypothetical protein
LTAVAIRLAFLKKIDRQYWNAAPRASSHSRVSFQKVKKLSVTDFFFWYWRSQQWIGEQWDALKSRILLRSLMDYVTDSVIFYTDCVSNGLGHSWIPVQLQVHGFLCPPKPTFSTHYHKFLACKRVRGRDHSFIHCPKCVRRVYNLYLSINIGQVFDLI